VEYGIVMARCDANGLVSEVRAEAELMNTEADYWEIRPVIREDGLAFNLRKCWQDAEGKKYRDLHGTFYTVDEAKDAITHLESDPLRIAAKVAE
jgi:hypothetical protein